jgi:IS5 family transposase
MYRKTTGQIRISDDFFLPFGVKLNKDNRWVKLEALIPWWELEDKYAKCFRRTNRGEKALSVRVALGTLIIQTKLNLTDRETVNQIKENPYLQYFLGFDQYNDTRPPFDPSLIVHFRKRLTEDIMIEINEQIAMAAIEAEETAKPKKKTNKKDDDDTQGGPDGSGSTDSECQKEPENKGQLILDATCAPADIHYPTDVRLLNEAREKLEDIIDTLHQPDAGILKKPRTYRKEARKNYLGLEKQRKKAHKAIRKVIGKQLGYVRRNLETIDRYLEKTDREQLLSRRQRDNLKTIRVLFEQQLFMHKNRTHSVENRIVSITQPHIRPIVRGKAGADVEFGCKVMTSVVNGYSFVERMSFDSFNEGTLLKEAVENYKERFGCYPESVMADTIFRNRDNLAYLKLHGIRISGPRLGRPAKSLVKAVRAQERLDTGIRNAIEGTYGNAKRKQGLSRIKAKLEITATTSIALQFLVLNLEKRLRFLLAHFLFVFSRCFWGPRSAALANY